MLFTMLLVNQARGVKNLSFFVKLSHVKSFNPCIDTSFATPTCSSHLHTSVLRPLMGQKEVNENCCVLSMAQCYICARVRLCPGAV